MKYYCKQTKRLKGYFPHIEENDVVYEDDINKTNIQNKSFIGIATVDNPNDEIPNDILENVDFCVQSKGLQKSEVRDILLSRCFQSNRA